MISVNICAEGTQKCFAFNTTGLQRCGKNEKKKKPKQNICLYSEIVRGNYREKKGVEKKRMKDLWK